MRQVNKAHNVILFVSPTSPQWWEVVRIKDYGLKDETTKINGAATSFQFRNLFVHGVSH